MLQFDMDNRKTITFSLDVEGSSAESLRYMLRLIFGEVEYGFKGVYQKEGAANIVKFNLPPLSTIGYFPAKEFDVCLEIIGDKFFASPWKDQGEFLEQPKVSSTLISTGEERNVTPKIRPKKREIVNEDDTNMSDKVEEARQFLKRSSKTMKVSGKVDRLSSLLDHSASHLDEGNVNTSKKSPTNYTEGSEREVATSLLKGLSLMKGSKMGAE